MNLWISLRAQPLYITSSMGEKSFPVLIGGFLKCYKFVCCSLLSQEVVLLASTGFIALKF